MAIPLPLNAAQRKQIYDAVTADKSPSVADADSLRPASELSPDQALNGMHPVPESVRSIDGLAHLSYVKGKDRVFFPFSEGSARTQFLFQSVAERFAARVRDEYGLDAEASQAEFWFVVVSWERKD